MDGETRAAVLSLGEQIAATLDEHDLLARWMSHYLAELLHATEGLIGADRDSAEQEVASLIVQIWERRRTVPMREDPLSLSDSVVRALARLDPDAGPFRFFGRFDEEAGPSPAEAEANGTLKLALDIDESAGELVRSLMRYAAIVAADHDAAWVRAAEATRDVTIRDLRRLIRREADAGTDPVSGERVRIAERAARLGRLMRSTARVFSEPGAAAPKS